MPDDANPAPAPKMRAKLRVGSIIPVFNGTETVTMFAVAASRYPEDGSDENNTYAKMSPSARFELHLANPALVGTFGIGDEFYVDFIKVPKPIPAATA